MAKSDRDPHPYPMPETSDPAGQPHATQAAGPQPTAPHPATDPYFAAHSPEDPLAPYRTPTADPLGEQAATAPYAGSPQQPVSSPQGMATPQPEPTTQKLPGGHGHFPSQTQDPQGFPQAPGGGSQTTAFPQDFPEPQAPMGNPTAGYQQPTTGFPHPQDTMGTPGVWGEDQVAQTATQTQPHSQTQNELGVPGGTSPMATPPQREAYAPAGHMPSQEPLSPAAHEAGPEADYHRSAGAWDMGDFQTEPAAANPNYGAGQEGNLGASGFATSDPQPKNIYGHIQEPPLSEQRLPPNPSSPSPANVGLGGAETAPGQMGQSASDPSLGANFSWQQGPMDPGLEQAHQSPQTMGHIPQESAHAGEFSDYAGHAAQAHQAHEYGSEDPEGAYLSPAPPQKGKGRFVLVGLVLAGAIGAGGLLAYLFQGSDDGASGKAPVIRADNRPVKVKGPEGPPPKRTKRIYDRLQGNRSAERERLVPRKETVPERLAKATPAPVAIPNTPPPMRKAIPPTEEQKAANGAQPDKTVRTAYSLVKSPATTASAPPPKAAPRPGAPRKVKIMTVRPDGTIVAAPPTPKPAPKPTAVTPPPTAPQPRAAVPTRQPPTNPAGTGIASTRQASVTPAPSAPTSMANRTVTPPAPAPQPRVASVPQPMPKPRPHTETARAATPAPARPETATASPYAGKYAVQVTARRSQAAALEAFADLQQKYASILGTYQPLIQRADLGERGVWFRLRVGPLDSKKAADALCAKLKAAGHKGCFTRRL